MNFIIQNFQKKPESKLTAEEPIPAKVNTQSNIDYFDKTKKYKKKTKTPTI